MSRLGTLTLALHGRRRHPAPDAHAQRADAAGPPPPCRSDVAGTARARHRAVPADRLARAGPPRARAARLPNRPPPRPRPTPEGARLARAAGRLPSARGRAAGLYESDPT